MSLPRIAGIRMSDPASDTFVGGIKNYLRAIGFLLPMLGGGQLLSANPAVLPVWASWLLIFAGLPVYIAPAIWRFFGRLFKRRSSGGA